MMFRLSALLLIGVIFLPVAAFSEATELKKGPASSEETGLFPLEVLVRAESGPLVWAPDWPSTFPPDAFELKTGSARSIELGLVSKDIDVTDEAVSALARWDKQGRILEFPFARAGKTAQATLVRSSAGVVIALTVVAAGKKIAPGAAVSAPGETAPAATEARSVRFKYADDGLIETASFQGEADSSASVFLFRGIQGAPTMSYAGRSATETRTNRTGTVTAVYDYTFFKNKLLVLTGRTEEGADEDLLRFDYDSFGRVVSVASPDYQAEALYDAVGRPVYWRIRGGIEGEGTDSFQRTYQWDERGLLVRERVSVDDGWSEFRYEYSFDSSGNWVERRSTKWEMRFGSLVSEPGPRLFRAIRYR